jgi:hypothetical protein
MHIEDSKKPPTHYPGEETYEEMSVRSIHVCLARHCNIIHGSFIPFPLPRGSLSSAVWSEAFRCSLPPSRDCGKSPVEPREARSKRDVLQGTLSLYGTNRSVQPSTA